MNDEKLPNDLRPAVKPGDIIETVVRLQGGGWFWGTRVAVKWIGSNGAVYVRYRHGKVDKIANEWRVARPKAA